ncbi:MAG TPA: hypothetical protein VGP13_02185 [Candidatus Paceibacterota bacterium]|jgi:hypothetical protein|nr:hypothetical protein [Candidatus Paceibacterota bacterium]
MSEKVANKLGIPAIIAIAAAATLLYSLWGASVLSAERQAGLSAGTQHAVAVNN